MFSIILATYNGADKLPDLLVSFTKQIRLEAIEFELIIVDNTSYDETSSVAEEFRKSYSWLRYVRENKLGINHARNRGILEAVGDVLIFVDDDIVFARSWLLAYQRLFTTQTDVLMAGGRVSCFIPKGIIIPEWLAMEGEFSFPYITFSVELGDVLKPIPIIDQESIPVGPNMAFRRQVFMNYGLFRTDLGLKGKQLMPGAEYEFFNRLKNRNLCWYYVPEAQIFHPVKASQLCQRYFLKRTFGVGRVAAKTMPLSPDTRKIGNVPLFSFRMLLASFWHYFVALPSGNPKKIFYRKAQIYKIAGLIYEWVSPRAE